MDPGFSPNNSNSASDHETQLVFGSQLQLPRRAILCACWSRISVSRRVDLVCFRSSTSVHVPTHDSISPAALRSGSWRAMCQRYSPSVRRIRISKVRGTPFRRASDHSLTACETSSEWITLCHDQPVKSVSAMPVYSTVFEFKCVTAPSGLAVQTICGMALANSRYCSSLTR